MNIGAALKRGCLAAALFGLCAVGTASHADIFYSYSTMLDVIAGPDGAGLDGASALIEFRVASGETYIERFSYPAVPVLDEMITISGASVGGNNGPFALEPSAFYPTFAGFFTEPGGNFINLLLPSSHTLEIRGNTDPSPDGAGVSIGDTVALSHFVPATASSLAIWSLSDGTEYSLVGTSITAFDTAAVPEPGSAALLIGVGMTCAGMLARRRQRK